MQRKPGYPVANCNIKMPDSVPQAEAVPCDDDGDQLQRRQQLINFGHTQWGFNNWSWSVTKQDLDFVDFSNGKYCAGVVAFVSITVKTLDIHRDNIGYATCAAGLKGSAIYQARKCAVTNALRETLLSFGGAVAAELLELPAPQRPAAAPEPENNQNLANAERLSPKSRKDSEGAVHPARVALGPPLVKGVQPPPVARALPMPAPLPPAPRAPPPRAPLPPRANPNVSFVLQPVLGAPLMPPRLPPPPYPNYYEYAPWPFYEGFERPHGNVNLNFAAPPKNLVVNGRACANDEGCWIKPTIFYDGFWTEQKVRKWVAEQVEKQFPEERKPASPNGPDAKC